MNRSSKLRRRVVFDKIPLDCWTHVVTFIRSPKDFLSIVRVVKGFLEYVKNICPRCTINIHFVPSEIPQNPISYVLNLVHHVEHNGEENDTCYLNMSEGEFFRKVIDKFSNLQNFSMKIESLSVTDRAAVGNIPRLIECSAEDVHTSLKRISLSFQDGSLTFDPPNLPKLEELEIMRTDESGNLFEEREDFVLFELEIKNPGRMNNLSSLKLKSWFLKNSLESFSKLRDLSLNNNLSSEREYFDQRFRCLETLEIGGLSYFNYKGVKNVDTLKTLVINEEFDDRDFMEINFSLEYILPSLERLVISIFYDGRYKHDPNGANTLRITQDRYPNLKTFELMNRSQTGGYGEGDLRVLLNHRNLQVLDVRYWDNFDLVDEKSLLEVEKMVYKSSISKNLLKTITKLKKLKYILICDPCQFYRTVQQLRLFEESISFVSFPFLKEIVTNCLQIKEIKDCPKIQDVSFLPTMDFESTCIFDSCTANFPSNVHENVLSGMYVEEEEGDEESRVPALVPSFNQFLSEKITEIETNFLKVQVSCTLALKSTDQSYHITQSGTNFRESLKKIWMLLDLNDRQKPLHVTLRDFNHLEEIVVTQIYGCEFSMFCGLENFPSLEVLSIGHLCQPFDIDSHEELFFMTEENERKMVDDDDDDDEKTKSTKKRRLDLSNLPKCKNLEITPYSLLLYRNKWASDLPQISHLDIVLNDYKWMKLIRETHSNRNLEVHISGVDFPNLKKLTIGVILEEEELGDDEIEIIEMISDLKRLRKIRMKGHRHNNVLLVRKLRNINVLPGFLTIDCDDFQVGDRKSGDLEYEKRKMSLEEYNRDLEGRIGKSIEVIGT